MTTGRHSQVFQQLRQAVLARDGAGLTDAELMSHFVVRRDRAALEALIRRHGSMVWSVCRRVLSNEQDAEDAFQASFLVFVRKAASIRGRAQVGNWLYGVAYRTALKARSATALRRDKERRAAAMNSTQAPTEEGWTELLPLLDQELARLPDKYRTALVLCELEGRSRKEAARQLDIPEGTLSSRLAAGRRMLAKRLGRPGLALSAGALATASAVPPTLMASTIKTSSLVAAGTAAAGVVSVRVAALAEGVVRAMFLSKITVGAALLAMVAVLAAGAGVAYCAGAADPKPQAQTPPVAAVQAKESNVDKDDIKGEEPPPWGEAVDGVQARLRPAQARWDAGAPPDFILDLRNQGEKKPYQCRVPNFCMIEWDGKWYRWGGSDELECKSTVLEPGKQIDDWVKVSLKVPWLNGRPAWIKGSQPLEIFAGKHRLRVSFTFEPAGYPLGEKGLKTEVAPNIKREQGIFVVSQLVNVEVGKESAWGEAVDGVQARIRTPKIVWKEGEAPTFSLDLRNRDKRTPHGLRIPFDAEIQVDETWRLYGGSVDFKAVDSPLPPGKQIDDWVKVAADELWVNETPGPVRGLKDHLSLPPGKHTVRLAFKLDGDKPVRPISGPIEVEVVKKDESAWGEPVDGVQLRLRILKPVVGAIGPQEFALDVRNEGDHDVSQCRLPNFCELELDDRWYVFGGARELECKAYFLHPGTQIDDWVKTSLEAPWSRPVHSNVDAPTFHLPEQERLRVEQGKHTVRVAFVFNEKIRPISQPAVFELGKESTWGEAVDGVQARIRTPKAVWAVGETPTFHLDLRNQGTKTPDQRRVPYDCQIEVDKVWYSFDKPSGPYVSVGELLKPGEQVNDWTIVSPDKNWGSFPGKARHFPLPPGKHTVRVAYRLQGTTPAIRPISGPIEIEVFERPAPEVPLDGVKPPPAKEVAPPALGPKGSPLVPVVRASFDKVPLAEALATLAAGSGTKVILAGYAAKEGETKVTASLVDVPLDTALVIVADAANLRPVRLGTVYYITTRERARLLEKDEQERRSEEEKGKEEPAKPPANETDAK